MADAAPVALTLAWSSYRNGDYGLLNNVWGTPAELRDKPVSQVAVTAASGADIRTGVTMQWEFPTNRSPASVWGYPEVYWGGQFGATVPALTTTVENLRTLNVEYAVRATGDFDVLIELFTTNDAGQVTSEIGVIVHGGNGRGPAAYADEHLTASVNLNANGAAGIRFFLYQSLVDKPSGTISFSNILADLVARGVVNPKDHVSGVELGAEMTGGSGALQVDRFAVFEALKATHVVSLTGVAAGQVFDVTTNNDYRIDGGPAGAGTSVVRIDTAFAASRVGVAADGHLSVFHPLYGAIDLTRIGQIQFADRMVAAANLPAPTAGGDALQTTADIHEIHGGAGNDTLVSTVADGYLRGDDGDDSLAGATGFDDLNGNRGADTVAGGGGGDWVLGGQDDDLLRGEDGDDVVNGNLGADRAEGGAGRDTLRGGQGADVLAGQGGDDWLSGDRDADTLTGGAGADIFHTFAEAGIDRVSDFNRAEGDRVLVDPGLSFTTAQVGADVVVTVAGQAQLILVGVQIGQLTGDWIVSQ